MFQLVAIGYDDACCLGCSGGKDGNMKQLLALIIACGSIVPFSLASSTPAAVPPTPAIQTLIDQLGSDSFADREAASARLEKIGPPATEALRLATRSENPEIRDRAVSILARIQRVVDSNERLTAKRLALSYKNIPIGTAVNDLRLQTGLNLMLDPNRISNPLRLVTCETKELPVWEALEAFCIAAGLREVFATELDVPKQLVTRRGYVPPPQIPNADTIPVLLIDGKPDRLPGDRSTAVRILVLPPSFPGHKVTLGTGDVNLCLDVTPSPGIAWQDITGVKVTRVIDSAGRFGGSGTEKNPPPTISEPNGMVVFARPGVAMRLDATGNSVPPETLPNPRVFGLPLKVSTANATSLKRLEGVLFAEVHALNQQLITVTDPKRNTNVVMSGPGELRSTILEVKEATGPGALGLIRVQLEYPSPWLINARRRGGAWNPGWPEPPRTNTQANRVEFFDTAGKPFPVTSTGYTEMSDDGMVVIQIVQFNFSRESGLPAKLVVVGPKSVLVQIPFALDNVPLP